MHRRSLVHENDAFGRGRAVAQCAVRSDGVVVNAPLLDQDLRLPQAVEDVAVELFIPEPSVEALAVSILTW